MNLQQEVLPIRKEIEELCKKYRITFLGIFGSYARGDFKKDSDIDILVEFKETKSLLDIIRIEFELSEIFNRKAEIVEVDGINERLKRDIMDKVVIVYEER